MRKRGLIIVIMMAALLAPKYTVCAETVSAQYESKTGTINTYTYEPTISVTSSTLGNISGGDVGIYYYQPSAGMQTSFVQSTSRTVTARVYEYDSSEGSAQLSRTRVGTFGFYGSLYAPKFWSYTYTYTGMIEDDNRAELRHSWIIGSISGDESVSVPKKIMKYRYWVY